MELVRQTLELQLGVDGIHAVGHDEGRTLGAFGQEVAHRAIEGASHAHRLSVAGQEGEGAVDLCHAGCITAENPFNGLGLRDVAQTVQRGIQEVDDALNVLRVHGRHLGSSWGGDQPVRWTWVCRARVR